MFFNSYFSNQIDFIYEGKTNIINPLYEKTEVDISTFIIYKFLHPNVVWQNQK